MGLGIRQNPSINPQTGIVKGINSDLPEKDEEDKKEDSAEQEQKQAPPEKKAVSAQDSSLSLVENHPRPPITLLYTEEDASTDTASQPTQLSNSKYSRLS